MEKQKSWKKWISLFLFAVCIIIVYKTVDSFADIANWIGGLFKILMPFVVGLLIAYLLYLPCKKVEKWYRKSKKVKFISKRARGLSILTVYILAVILITMVIHFIVPALVQSLNDLINNFQNYYTMATSKLEELPENSILRSDIVQQGIESISNIDLKQYFNMNKIAEYAKGAVDIVNHVFDAFVAIIVSIYILLERTEIVKFIKKIIKVTFHKKAYENLEKYFDSGNEIFFKFLTSQLLDGIVVGILTSIAMSILGVKYAVLLGFMIGLFNLIPYFGAIIAVSIAILITLLTGGIGQAIWMAVVVIVLQQIDANIINPKIVGSSLKISPLLVIFAVTIGGAYFGILGMFLAVPIVTVMKLIVSDYIEYKEKKEENIER